MLIMERKVERFIFSDAEEIFLNAWSCEKIPSHVHSLTVLPKAQRGLCPCEPLALGSLALELEVERPNRNVCLGPSL